MVNAAPLATQTFINRLVLTPLIALIVSCGGGSGGDSPTAGATTNPTAPQQAPRDYWNVPTPDYSPNSSRPVITLNGDHTVYVGVNGTYTDRGASAIDLEDGNLTETITTSSDLDLTQKGDYIIRYSVADSSGQNALEALRVIRVTDDAPAVESRRPIGATMSHLGYIEHLPTDYGRDPNATYPLLIYNHGGAANAQFAGDDPLLALNALVNNAGPPLLINAGKWDENLPFIVLMPHAGFIEGSDPVARLNGYLDYAIQSYAVDTSRIYLTGWSQGGFIGIDYASYHPERVAAILAISPSDPFGGVVPPNFCDIESVPIWIFHGDQDEVIPVQRSVDLFNELSQVCQPTELPKLTILKDSLHAIHHSVFNLTAMSGGNLGLEHDATYDAYDQSIFDWLLSYKRE